MRVILPPWPTAAVLLLLALIVFWAVGCHNRLQALRGMCLSELRSVQDALAERNRQLQVLLKLLDAYVQHQRSTWRACEEAVLAADNAARAVLTARSPAYETAHTAWMQAEGAVLGFLSALHAHEASFANLKVHAELTARFAELRVAADRASHNARRYNEAAASFDTASAPQPARGLARSFKLSGFLRFEAQATPEPSAPKQLTLI